MCRLDAWSTDRIAISARFAKERVTRNIPSISVPRRTETEDIRSGASGGQNADKNQRHRPSRPIYNLPYQMLVQSVFGHCPQEASNWRGYKLYPTGFIGPLVRRDSGQGNKVCTVVT